MTTSNYHFNTNTWDHNVMKIEHMTIGCITNTAEQTMDLDTLNKIQQQSDYKTPT